jgi:hypothetical protein
LEEWNKSIARDLIKYYEMNELERAMYRRKLMRDIEAAQHASAEMITEKLMTRCMND